MHENQHIAPPRRQFSLAQQGVGVRVAIALLLVGLVWVAIGPLVVG